MARLRQLLKDSQWLQERSIGAVSGIGLEDYSHRTPAFNPLAKEFYANWFKANPAANAYNSWQRRTGFYYSQNDMDRANADYIKAHSNLPQWLIEILPISYSYSNNDSATVWFFMLNEFLQQTETEDYKEFLDANWDALFDKAISHQIQIYPHTKALYSHFDENSLFVVRTDGAKKIQTAIESLTKEQFLHLIARKKLNVQTKSVILFLENELNKTSEDDKKISKKEAFNALHRAFFKNVVQYGDNFDLYALNDKFNGIIKEIHYSVVDEDSRYYRSTSLSSENFGRITLFLEENATKFTLPQMFFIVYSFQSPKLFTRTGSSVDYNMLLQDFIKKDNAIEIFQFIGDLGASYTKEVPTLHQWTKALKQDILDFIIDPASTVAMVYPSSKPLAISQTAQAHRNFFNGAASGY